MPPVVMPPLQTGTGWLFPQAIISQHETRACRAVLFTTTGTQRAAARFRDRCEGYKHPGPLQGVYMGFLDWIGRLLAMGSRHGKEQSEEEEEEEIEELVALEII